LLVVEQKLLQNLKMIFVAFENTFLAQLAYFGGKSASVYLKIIRKLLPVKGDIKAVAVCLFRLYHKICHQLFPCGALGGYLDALVKENGLCGKVFHKVKDKLLVESAVVGAGVKNVLTVYKHYLAGLVSHHAYGQRLGFGTGKSLGKDLRGLYVGKNTSVSEIIDLNYLRRAR